jgi:L-alanine-DL-glutamate epimerase-like enolase superfamily enzyme
MAVMAERAVGVEVEGLDVGIHDVATESPESDGTLTWDSTTAIVVRAHAAGRIGLGYTYGADSVGHFVESKLAEQVRGADAMHPQAAWASMQGAIRNAGRPGIAAMAISAVDVALWDLKARLLELPLADLLGRFHDAVAIYASGGFTSWSDRELRSWAAESAGIGRVKIKVGREPERDPERLRVVRRAVGDGVELMVDANGAFTSKEALLWAQRYAEYGVTYFEEPVTSEDRAGLRFVRDRGPAGMEIAAGEYEWDLPQLRDLAGCVDVLQADVTRCGGITNLLRVDGICKSRALPFSAHCAPAISAHVCAAMECARHIEYFHDHVRVEEQLFEGTLKPEGGALRPDSSRPGLGLELR